MVAGCAGRTGTAAPAAVQQLHVVLDYSPTLSDAGALLYLASNPRVDLLAVTLPGTGEADCGPGTRTTRSLLKIASKPDWTLLPTTFGDPSVNARALGALLADERIPWFPDSAPRVHERATRDADIRGAQGMRWPSDRRQTFRRRRLKRLARNQSPLHEYFQLFALRQDRFQRLAWNQSPLHEYL
jgi:hypothetical protein